ncbi:CcmD family protein [Chondrinema litorale]|uniref:CcmD family protein n=1 Tax=Chondrinema litorale TaxID=2994555 RepID=UPI002542DBFA|nr:CcmD family protein [Chondrinema litorale]UZR93245.1 CcmD family protein [Chondrinema litorale]
MYKYIKILLLSFALSFSFAESSMAQEKQKITEQDYSNNEIEMADVMRSNGKIYIVVATVFSLFAGIVVYLVMLDKKIGALEKNISDDSI